MAREYKDSGIEWIGEIPKEWKVMPFKQMYELGKGLSITKADLVEEGIPVISYGQIHSKANTGTTIKDELIRYVPGEFLDVNASSLVKKGDIIFADTSEDLDGCGNCVYIDRDITIFAGYHTIIAKYLSSEPNNYLSYLFKTDCWRSQIRSGVNGVKLFSVPQRLLGRTTIILPPLFEQQKIADYLDKVCEEVDEMIALQEQMIDELKAYKQSVITEAVTKGLNPNVLMKDSGIDWIGEIPEHWEIVPIKHIKSKELNAFVDGPFGSNLKSEHFIENGDVLVVESGFITTGKFIFKEFKTISKEHFETIKRSQCKAKDIIIAKIGANYGMAGELPDLGKPSVVSGNSLKITLDNSKMLNTIFVNAMICAKNNGGFKGMVQENAQPALSLSGLNNFKLPVPPLSEQQTITSYLDTKCSEIDALIAIKQSKIEELKEYKKSVIYEYVTGKKGVV